MAQVEKFNVLYVGAPNVIAELKSDFLKVGAEKSPTNENELIVGKSVSKRFIANGENKPGLSHTSVYFHSDLLEAVKLVTLIDVDLVILDERTYSKRKVAEKKVDEEELGEVLVSAPIKNSEPAAITLEEFGLSIQKFTPRSFHYPSRRIIVILPASSKTTNRAFELGLANVRAVITEPVSSAQLFSYATNQLYDVRKYARKTAVCISGGGLEGFIYSIGVLNALDDALVKKGCTDFDIFCGVSSGGIASSTLAIGVKPIEMLKMLYKKSGALDPLTVGTIFDFAGTEFVTRMFRFIKGLASFDPVQTVQRLQELVPVGLFKGEKLKKFLEKQFEKLGVADSFTTLTKELYISATDLDSNEHVVFGQEPWRDIKISQAVRASCALPPFFLPERINGHWFTDGQLTSSSDFNIAIRKGAGLVMLIDPMVAFASNEPGSVMSKGGFFCTIQAIKSLVQTRVSSMLRHAMDNHPDVDFMVFQPTDEVMAAMAGNPMNYRIRPELAELGYSATIQQVISSYEAYSHKFAKHNFQLKTKEELEALIKA